MATYPGELAAAPALYGPLPGASGGSIGRPPPGLGAVVLAALGSLGGFPPAPAVLGPPVTPTVVGNGKYAPWLSGTFDWFDRIHVLPRVPVNFGRVVVQTDRPYEVASMYSVPVTLVSYSFPSGIGLSLPGIPAVGTRLAPYGSLLDASSTPGFPVRLIARVAPSGTPVFAGDIIFNFVPGGAARLGVVGFRFELLPYAYEAPLLESLEWATVVLPISEGKEQRIGRREVPRQRFEPTLLLQDGDRRQLQAALFGAQGRAFALPIWTDSVLLTAAAAPGAGTLTVADTSYVDFRVGGFALLIDDAGTMDVVQIDAVATNLVTVNIDLPTIGAYAPGAKLVPLRVAFLSPPVAAARYPVTIEQFSLECVVIDNATGAPTGDLTPFPMVYGYPIIDGNVLFESKLGESFLSKVVFIDNVVGQPYQDQEWPTNKRAASIGFSAQSRAAAWQFRRMLYGLRGKQSAFWMPTGAEDLEVVADLVIATDTLDVAAIGYTAHVQSRLGKSTIRITFTDGSGLYRQVLSSVEVSATVERLTLDDTWPANRAIAEVARVEFLELVRFDSDRVDIEHAYAGRLRSRVPIITVMDAP